MSITPVRSVSSSTENKRRQCCAAPQRPSRLRTSPYCEAESRLLSVVDGHTLVLLNATAASTSWHHNAAENETVRRFLSMATVALDHHGGRLVAGGFFCLQLSDVHVQRTVDTERCSQEKMNCASRRCKSVLGARLPKTSTRDESPVSSPHVLWTKKL